MSSANFQTLCYELDGQIAQIILDRPPANLIDRDSTLEYHAALRLADEDPEVRVVVLSGAGRGLSAGVDLNYLESFGSEEMKDFLTLFYVETLCIVRGWASRSSRQFMAMPGRVPAPWRFLATW